jgi:hypothetical protein
MTKQNKLIVGAVVVVVGLYLYKQNKTKNEVANLKSGADVMPPPPIDNTVGGTPISAQTGGIKLAQEDFRKKGQAEVTQLNFAGKRGNSYFETIF